MRAPSWLLAIVVALAGVAFIASAPAAAPDAVAFDVPGGPLESALAAFNAQSGVQVLVPAELAAGVRVPAITGTMQPRTALERMLDGTGLMVSPGASGQAYAIVRRSASAGAAITRNAAAIIVVGLAADADQAKRLWEAADGIRFGLTKRGVPGPAIAVIPEHRGGKARRGAFFAAAQAVKPSVEETWLVLLGDAAPDRNGQPAFQVSGPRISADDIARTAASLPGEKYVVLAMANGGGLLRPLVRLPQVEAVSATAETGEPNEPRFPQLWAGALDDAPQATFRELASTAAARVEHFYVEHSLAQGEHAHLIDRPSGRVIGAPFNRAPLPAAAP